MPQTKAAHPLFALIPALNEERNIGAVVCECRHHVDVVVVVDDGSSDMTASEATAAGAVAISHCRRGGKGAALRTGFDYALLHGACWVVTLDGDGQHAPSDIAVMLRRRDEQDADIVIGSRMADLRGMPFHRIFTNRASSAIVSWLCGRRMADTQSGFRLISADVLKRVHTTLSSYDMESEFLVKAARLGFRIAEVPVATIYDENARSKIRPLRETYRFLKAMAEMYWVRTAGPDGILERQSEAAAKQSPRPFAPE